MEGQPNIYCQLESGLFFPNQQLPDDPEERDETVTELRFIPRDIEACKWINNKTGFTLVNSSFI
jgi:nucleotide-sensitive chloride channel 1A